ncbi:hypothetical protein PVK06_048473 [Gossypium arboreum]|uniref:Uncharacterized protein n=1 Tax=Gossypium arboreum TaxID=29729 RepID=A0ABR0MGC7_GOSAR|nr:hypothetical protein PVK06_048473 [Gossypium arboreum]
MDLENDFFLVRFQDKNDYNKALVGGSWGNWPNNLTSCKVGCSNGLCSHGTVCIVGGGRGALWPLVDGGAMEREGIDSQGRGRVMVPTMLVGLRGLQRLEILGEKIMPLSMDKLMVIKRE